MWNFVSVCVWLFHLDFHANCTPPTLLSLFSCLVFSISATFTTQCGWLFITFHFFLLLIDMQLIILFWVFFFFFYFTHIKANASMWLTKKVLPTFRFVRFTIHVFFLARSGQCSTKKFVFTNSTQFPMKVLAINCSSSVESIPEWAFLFKNIFFFFFSLRPKLQTA